LESHARRHDVLASADAPGSAAASAAVATLAQQLTSDGTSTAAALIIKGKIGGGRIRINLCPKALTAACGLPGTNLTLGLLAVDEPFSCRRRGVEMKIIAGERAPMPDKALLQALRRAHRWTKALKSGTPLRRLASEEDISGRYMARTIPLAGLSPKIQTAIFEGRHPVELTLKRLLRHQLPLDWRDQERLLGMGP
jgi:hypothetical protein